ncbi:MAG TPA: 2-oxoacid:acceptor oxidoreductase family protein [Candidatus Nanopelagicales bacterium]|nr:2-oxoacid:acceptor oxidoreductase family protein [Candidatus Nanopelagicales bacterium]
MERSIIFAGFGGQGILFAGKVLARAAMNEEREVLWIPSYGPEMRGGTASCTVIVGSEPIGSPIVDQADAAVVLNPPSLAKFASHVAPGGLLVVNETLVGEASGRTDITELRIPCTRLAKDAGDDSLVSVVALGALVGYLQLVRAASVRNAMRDTVGAKRPEVLAADLAAFDVGHRVGARSRGPRAEHAPVPA